jgi:hypothetical protein
MRQQDIGGIVYGETGNMLGHEMLSYRPVNEAAQSLPSVIILTVNRRSNVIKCVCVSCA